MLPTRIFSIYNTPDQCHPKQPKKEKNTRFLRISRAFSLSIGFFGNNSSLKISYPLLGCGRHSTSLHIWPRYFSTYTSWPMPSRATNQTRVPLNHGQKTRFLSRYREFWKKFVSLVVIHTWYADGTSHLLTYGQGISPHIDTGGHAVQGLHCV